MAPRFVLKIEDRDFDNRQLQAKGLQRQFVQSLDKHTDKLEK